MMTVWRLVRGLAALGLLLLAAIAGAPAVNAGTDATLSVRTLDTTAWPTVRMTVQYQGERQPKLQDFTVRNNGEVINGVTARPLAETQTAVGVVLVIDTSGSMREQARMEAAVAAARSFVAGRGPNEKIAVVAFSDQPLVVHPFSAGNAAAGAIDNLRTSGGTALWDAVRSAAGLFADEPQVQPNIVVLSDGADSASVSSPSDARSAALGAHAVVHTIGFASSALDAAGLDGLATATGGKSLVAADPAQVGALFAQIRRGLDQQFELMWRASGSPALDLTVSVADATTTARGAAGSVSHERATRPEPVAAPNGLVHIAQSGGRYIAILGAGALAVIAVVGVGVRMNDPGGLMDRLRAYEGEPTQAEAVERQLRMSLATSSMTRHVVAKATSAIEGRGLLEWVDRKLDAARLPIRAAEAAFFTVAFAGVLAVIAWVVSGPLLAVVALALGLGGPAATLSFLGFRRRRKFVRQLPSMLQLLASSLRAGYALLQGCEAVAREIEDPMGAELRRVLAEARLGRPLEDALEEAALRMGSADFAWVVMAIGIQRNVGGNLAELLDTVADTMISRTRLRREVKALTAEGRMSAIMLGIMPPALAVAMSVMSPGYLDPLVTETMGRAMLGGGTLMLVLGFIWMQKIIKVDA